MKAQRVSERLENVIRCLFLPLYGLAWGTAVKNFSPRRRARPCARDTASRDAIKMDDISLEEKLAALEGLSGKSGNKPLNLAEIRRGVESVISVS